MNTELKIPTCPKCGQHFEDGETLERTSDNRVIHLRCMLSPVDQKPTTIGKLANG